MRVARLVESHGIMLKLGLISMFMMVTATAITVPACSSVDRAFDCDQICNKYKDCADANYDADACAQRCRDNGADSESFDDAADDCQSCIDDRSCVGAAFNCSVECSAIVP